MKSRTLILGILALLWAHTGFAQQEKSLREQIDILIKEYKAIIGLSVNAGPEELHINSERRFPMQSVYKFPLALAILKRVDDGTLSLEQKVQIRPGDLHKNTWSPMRERFPKGNIELSVAEILRYSVSLSDNNACDILFRMAGGPAKVNDYIHSLGIQQIQIAATEHEMHQSWPVQYTNWCTPNAMNQLLQGFHEGKYLSAAGTAFLLQLMTGSENSGKRIKGLLPASVAVAHKTGSSGANKKGFTAAVNDVGIIRPDNGQALLISVFVSDTYLPYDENERIIAQIAKAVYDYYAAKP